METAGVAELELLAARGWQALEEERHGDWLLRAGAGFTGRANSVLTVGSPGGPLAAAVDDVAGWYAARGLRPCAQLPVPGAEEADAAFAAAGWQRDEDVLVLTAPLTDAGPPAVPVRLTAAPDQAWLDAYEYRGAPLPPTAVQVLTSARTAVFAAVGTGGTTTAVGRGALTDGWLGVTAVTVAAGSRGQGLGTAVMAALTGWALARGAHSVYLQVLASNEPALELYRRNGFTEHHRYHYRRPAR